MKRPMAVLGLVLATAALGAIALFAVTSASAGDGDLTQTHKVWVCKYVGKPGVDEVLKGGKNPIQVDGSATVGTWFKDGQNNSFVLDVVTDENTGQGEKYEGDKTCPGSGPPDVFAASAVCDTETGLYDVSGTINGEPATAEPATLPGSIAAEYNIVVSGGEKTGNATVETSGTCVKDTPPPPPPPAIEVTPGVTFRDPTCELGAAVLPTTTTGLTYTVEGKVAPGEKVTVTASANDGYTIRGNNRWEHTFGLVPTNCSTTPPPTDVCPNIEGIQEAVPDGLVLDPQGNCVAEKTTTETTPTAPLTPPTTSTKKPADKAPAKTKPAATTKPAPLTPPKQAVAGAYAEKPPKLAHTP